jgi:hypothetical protein
MKNNLYFADYLYYANIFVAQNFVLIYISGLITFVN